MSKFKGKYRIESTRLQKWNYGWDGKYFITIVTKNRGHFFGEIENKEMIHSEIGKLAEKYWYEIPAHFPFVRLDAFVVMPNHIHGIIIIDKKGLTDKINLEIQSARRQQGILAEDFISDEVTDLRDKACIVSTTTNKNSHSQSEGQKRFRNPEKSSVSSIVGSYKSVVSTQAHKIDKDFDWQDRFDDRIIWDEEGLAKIRNYIKNNPENWSDDEFRK